MPSPITRLKAQALYGFPRPLLGGRTPTERLRARSMAERLRENKAAVRWARYLLSMIGYPICLIPEVVSNFKNLQRQTPDLPASEAARMFARALLRNIPPAEYAIHRFDRPDVRNNEAAYMYWTDTPALLWLNRQRGADNQDVRDKARFARICVENELPHVATLAEFRGGAQVSGEPLAQLAVTDLWVKPTILNAGIGAMGWKHDGTEYRSDSGLRMAASEWAAMLSHTACIVQPRVHNHAGIAALTNGALAAVRLNTVIDRSGHASLLGAMIGLPFGTQTTTTGGIGGALNSATGTIHRLLLHGQDFSGVHPDTQEPILGRVVPQWNEVVSLALHAHRTAFPRFATLGWDVVITPQGPLLLEANSGWSTLGQQVFFGPLGNTPFDRIVREELDLAG